MIVQRSSRQRAAPSAEQEAGGEQDRADDHAGHRPEERAPCPTTTSGTRSASGLAPSDPEQRPGVEGVDRQVRRSRRRSRPCVARNSGMSRPKGSDQDEAARPAPAARRGDQPDGPLLPRPATPRSARGTHGRARGPRSRREQVAPQEHDGDERDEHDAELGLDERRPAPPTRPRPRSCRGTAPRRRAASPAPDGVGLAPEGRVVPGDRVEQVERRREQRQALRVASRATASASTSR